METQKNEIRKYLEKGKSITAIEALRRFGCFRLAARISNLKDEGMDIRTEIVCRDKKRFAKYTLYVC